MNKTKKEETKRGKVPPVLFLLVNPRFLELTAEMYFCLSKATKLSVFLVRLINEMYVTTRMLNMGLREIPDHFRDHKISIISREIRECPDNFQ